MQRGVRLAIVFLAVAAVAAFAASTRNVEMLWENSAVAHVYANDPKACSSAAALRRCRAMATGCSSSRANPAAARR